MTSNSIATIMLDGSPLNEILLQLKEQINQFNSKFNQQQTIIETITKNYEIEKEKTTTLINTNNELLNRLIQLENKPEPLYIKEEFQQLKKQINELFERPIVDINDRNRLLILEKKLASFYGDDINILGRVSNHFSILLFLSILKLIN